MLTDEIKKKRNIIMKTTIEKAKKRLENLDKEYSERGYGESGNKEKIKWLEASPPIGIIIADYTSGTVKVYGPSDLDLHYVCTYRPFSKDIKLKAD